MQTTVAVASQPLIFMAHDHSLQLLAELIGPNLAETLEARRPPFSCEIGTR